MALIEVRFSGSCVFVTPDIGQVEVFFLDLPVKGDMHGPADRHVPVLTSSRGVIEYTSADGPHPGRSSGIPIYLASWETSHWRLDGQRSQEDVEHIELADPGTKPADGAAWDDFAYCFDLSKLAPSVKFDIESSRSRAIHVMSLAGGRLKAAIPSQQRGDEPFSWRTIEGNEQTVFISDVVVYEREYGSGQLTLELGSEGRSPRTVYFARDADIRLTIVHEPFLTTLPKTARGEQGLHHLSMLFQEFSGVGLPVTSTPGPRRAPDTPDPTYCPPGRVRR